MSRSHPVESFIFQEKESENQRGKLACPKSQTQKVSIPVLKQGSMSLTLVQVQFYFTMSLFLTVI